MTARSRTTLFRAGLGLLWLVALVLAAVVVVDVSRVGNAWTEGVRREIHYDRSRTRERRILILGDSQLEQWNLRHCLAKDIQRFCDRHGLGCINAANSGFGPIEYRHRLKEIGSHYRPDTVIVFYYAGNDLTDVLYRSSDEPRKPRHDWAQLKERRGRIEPVREMPETGDGGLAVDFDSQRIAALRSTRFDWQRFAREGVDPQIIRYAQNRIMYPGRFGAEYVNPHILVVGTWERNYLFDNNAIDSTRSRYGWYRVAEELDGLLTEADAIGARLILVAIPSTVQVDDSHHAFYRRVTFNVSSELTTSDAPQRLLAEFARDADVPYLDLLPSFRRDPKSEELYFENDDHLSERGHVVAFQQVRDEILTPYLEHELDESSERVPIRARREHHRRYEEWAVDFVMQRIRNGQRWLSQVQKKAETSGVTLESALRRDALYVLREM